MVMRYVCLLAVLFFSSGLLSQIRIKMKPMGGRFVLPCMVNGIKFDALFDTGATDMTITVNEAEAMLRNGVLAKEDGLGIGEFQSADGMVHKKIVVIKCTIEAGGIKLKDIPTLVEDWEAASPVFGMSGIRRLGQIRLEGNELVIFDKEKEAVSGCSDIPRMLADAAGCFQDKKYNEAIGLYRKVYDTDPGKMGVRAWYELGRAYYLTGEYWQAERCLGKSVRLLEDRGEYEWYVYFWFAKTCYELQDYGKVMVACEKILAENHEISEKTEYEIYRMMGLSCSNMNRGQEALELLLGAASLHGHLYESPWPGKNGADQDLVLGELLYHLAMNFMDDDRWTSVIGLAALYGDENAMDLCGKLKINWEQYEDSDWVFKELLGGN